MTADNFKTFSICKSVGPDAAYECFAFDKSNFNGLYQDFFIPKENISIENQPTLYHINFLTQEKIYPNTFGAFHLIAWKQGLLKGGQLNADLIYFTQFFTVKIVYRVDPQLDPMGA